MLPDLQGFTPEEEARIQALVSQGMDQREARIQVLDQRGNPQGAAATTPTAAEPSNYMAGQEPRQPRDVSLLGGAPAAATMQPTAAATAAQPSTGGFLSQLASPFAGAEGKMRLLQVLGGLGQSALGYRASGQAEKRTASSQARANMVNALSRRNVAQGTQYQARPGVGFSLMGALAGAGQTGVSAMQSQREQAQQTWERGAKEREMGQGDVRLKQGEAELRQRGTESTADRAVREAELRQRHEEFGADLGVKKDELGLRRQEIGQRGELGREDLQIRRAALANQRYIAEVRARGKGSNAQDKTRRLQGVVQVLKDQYDRVERAGFVTGRGINSLTDPNASVYNESREGFAQLIATIQEGRSSDADRAAWRTMFPELTQTDKVRAGKWAILDEVLAAADEASNAGMVPNTGGIAASLAGGQFNKDAFYASLVPSTEQGTAPGTVEVPDAYDATGTSREW